MAISYQEVFEVAQQPGIQARVKALMQKAAIAVMNEAGSTAGHTQRVAFAGLVLNGQASVLQYTIGVLTNSTIMAEADTNGVTGGNSIPDNDLEFAVNSAYSAYAGYAPG